VARRRVLLSVHTGERGGASLMALEAARFLAASGDELVIAVPDGPLRAAFAECGRVTDGVASVPLWTDSPAAWARRCVRTAQHAVRLARVIRRERVDVVLVNSTVSVAAVLAARLAGVPAVVHARDTPFSRLAPLVMGLHARLAHTIVCIAARNEGYLPARGRRARVVRIPDGIHVPPAPAPAPAGFGTPLRLCVVGAVTPDKGQALAVEALGLLRAGGLDATLDLVGRVSDAAFAASLRAAATKLGVGDRVRLGGETDGIDAALDGADVLLLTSRGEGTPLVLMEALARLRPVVATDVGDVRAIVRDGDTGLLVVPGDAAGVAAAVRRLAADPAAARALARRGREHVEAHFEMDASLRALRAEVDRALTAPPARRKQRRPPAVARSWTPR
jgi:glycosyltransferase involved in cell wall biosynthesis